MLFVRFYRMKVLPLWLKKSSVLFFLLLKSERMMCIRALLVSSSHLMRYKRKFWNIINLAIRLASLFRESIEVDVSDITSTSHFYEGVQTRSKANLFDWGSCIFCKHKQYRHDNKLHKIEREERTQRIVHTAKEKRDTEILALVSSESFLKMFSTIVLV